MENIWPNPRPPHASQHRDDVIVTVMKEEGLTPDEVQSTGNKVSFVSHGIGEFRCLNCCSNTWQSSWTWAVLNFYEQQCHYLYGQKCRHCYNRVMPPNNYLYEQWERPIFEKKHWEHLVRNAVQSAKNYISYIDGTKPKEEEVEGQQPEIQLPEVPQLQEESVPTTGPHEVALCERCTSLHRPCWRRR